MLIVASRKHFVDHHEMESLIRVASRIDIILVCDGCHQNQEGELPLLSTRLPGSTVVIASRFPVAATSSLAAKLNQLRTSTTFSRQR